MSDSVKKKTTLVRYLLTGTTESLYEAAVEDKVNFSLNDHAAVLLAKGYEILESDLPQGDFETSLKTKTYTVYLRERVSVVFPGQPKREGEPVSGLAGLVWPAGLEDFDLTVSKSRQIRYQYKDGSQALPPVTETVEFERSAMVNHVTGQVTYMPWQPVGDGEFTQIETPALLGYRPDIETVAAVEEVELSDGSDQDVVVTFSKEKHRAQLQVVDRTTDEVLFSDELEGETDDVVDYPVQVILDKYKAQGYEILSNPFKKKQRFGQGKAKTKLQVFSVEVQPKVVLVATDDLPEVGKPVYPELEGSVVWPKGLEEKQLSRSVTRTIVSQHENGQVISTIDQTVSFNRSAKINLLTQEITYEDWKLVSEEATFPKYIPEELEGYSPRPRQLPKVSLVTVDGSNLQEVITYTRQIQRVTLRFVDSEQGGLILYQKELVGKTGDPIRFDYKKKIQEFLNIGYDVVDNEFPEGAMFSSEVTEKEVYDISLEPRTLVVSSKEPKEAGRFIDEKALNGPKWPVGVDEQSLCHLVKRTIHYRYENGKPAAESHVDTILFEREAEINLVTSQVFYSPWVSKEHGFADHQVPQLEGYYANREVITGIDNIEVTSPDFEVAVYYIKTSNQISYTIQDVTAKKTLESKLVNGRSVQKLREEIERKLQPYIAKGYRLENEQLLSLAMKNPDTRSLTISLSQEVREVTPDKPQPANGLVEGYSRLNWPSGLNRDQLTKDVSRQVRLVYANGEEISGLIDQRVTFTRKAHVNLVTAEVTYGDWESKNPIFPVIELPELDGYRPSLYELPEQTANANELDQLVEVIYYPQPAKLTVVYLEEGSKKELYRDELVAPVGETFNYQVADRLALIDLAAYDVVKSDCPDDLVFKAAEETYTLVLKPKTVTVTADQPHQEGTTSFLEGYGLFNWPAGVDKESLVGDVWRVIHYKTDLGEVLSDNPIKQEARLTRSAIVNLVTKEVTYQPWSSEAAQLEAVKSPGFGGLIPSLEEVPALDLRDGADLVHRVLEVVVSYHSKPYQCQFRFMDGLRQELLSAVDLMILDKKEAKEAYLELLGSYQQMGYVLTDEQELDLDNWKLADEKIFEISLKPQLMSVTIDHVNEQFASFDEEVAAQLQTLEGLSRLDLTRQVNRTIKYLYTNGKPVARAHTDSIQFKRSARVNLVTGEIFYDDWMSYYPVFDEVLSPVVDDYSPSQEIVAALEEVTAESQDIVETVIYTRNIQQVVVSVVDKATGNIIYAESITGTTGPADNAYEVSKFVKKGQEFVSEDSKPRPVAQEEQVLEAKSTSVPQEEKPDQSATSKTEQKKVTSKPVTSPAKKVTEKELLIGFKDDELQKTYGLSLSDLARTITRVVYFLNEDGKPVADKQIHKVAYKRQAKVEVKTQNISFTDWQAIDATLFPKITSPKVDGYDASQDSLPAYTPTPDDKMLLEERIIYRSAKIENMTVTFIDQETDEEVMSFNFANKSAEYRDKKIQKGLSFLTYKGYEVVSSNYPEQGEVLSDGTIRYQITIRQSDKDKTSDGQQKKADVTRQLREEINKKSNRDAAGPFKEDSNSFEEWPDQAEPRSEKDSKQKGLFNFLFKN